MKQIFILSILGMMLFSPVQTRAQAQVQAPGKTLSPAPVPAPAPASGDWHAPLDGPALLSGTFAELRSNHFHAGLDMKTNGSVGAPVYAADSGYVSRIAVSPYGYGLALYIDHPHRNRTTVYAHLDRLIPELQHYVLQHQYRKKSFPLNQYLSPDQFPIRRGQLVAYSGNSGGSAGPHLHFEIRNRQNQHPLNPMEEGIAVEDHVNPLVRGVHCAVGVGSDERVNFPVPQTVVSGYSKIADVSVPAGVDLGLMIDAYDQQTGSYNQNGLYSLQLIVGDSMVFQWTASEFSFDETRYCNAVMDFAENQQTGRKRYRLHRLPGNRLTSQRRQSGWFRLAAGDTVPYTISVMDFARNSSMISGRMIVATMPSKGDVQELGPIVPWDAPFEYEDSTFRVRIPAHTLYSDATWTLERFEGAYRMLHPRIPAHQRFEVSIAPDAALANDGKVVMVCEEDRNSKTVELCTYRSGWYTAEFRNFGTFYLSRDTVPPNLRLLSHNSKQLVFESIDSQLSLSHYHAFIDDSWVLLAYDAKSDRLLLEVDDRFRGRTVEVRVEVADEAGNRAEWVKNLTF